MSILTSEPKGLTPESRFNYTAAIFHVMSC